MTLRIGLVLAALLFVPGAGAAQGIVYGLKGGVDFATIAFDPEPGADFGLQPGLVVGGFTALPLGPRWSIQLEGLFAQKGAAVSEGGVDGKIRLDYFEVPALVKYAVTRGTTRAVHVFGGPTMAFNLRAESEAEFGGDDVELDIDEEVEALDVGLAFGVAVDVGRMTAEGRYTWGLTNITTDPEQEAARNRVLSFLLGIRF